MSIQPLQFKNRIKRVGRARLTYLTNITTRELVGEALKKKPLMFASKLVSSMNLDVAFRAQCRLIGAANHRRRSFLTHITLNLHLP